VGLAAVLKRLVRGAPPAAIATRLSESEVIGLAKQASADYGLSDELNVATARRDARGAVVWSVVTCGVGASLRVVIDDATGAVLERTSHGGR
jgi:hypothetical protein